MRDVSFLRFKVVLTTLNLGGVWWFASRDTDSKISQLLALLNSIIIGGIISDDRVWVKHIGTFVFSLQGRLSTSGQ